MLSLVGKTGGNLAHFLLRQISTVGKMTEPSSQKANLNEKSKEEK